MSYDPRTTSCPYTGMEKSCFDARLQRDCPKWVMFQGQQPNTGEAVAEWACADRWVPFLLADGNRRLVGVQAAVETRGDAVHEQQARVASLIERAARRTAPVTGHLPADASIRRLDCDLQDERVSA